MFISEQVTPAAVFRPDHSRLVGQFVAGAAGAICDALFDILTVEDADFLQELVKVKPHNAGELLKTFADVDEETAEMMRRL